ncbi:MAG TPA: signal peptidase I [Gemmatimonadales bacterium]|nr:signal peptidase I [Gemmatimonadales bacterium]
MTSRAAVPPSPRPTPPAPTSPPPKKTLKGEAKSWAKAIGVAFLIFVFLRSFLVEAFRIPSASMENTLLVGDFLFVDKISFGGELEIPLTGIHFLRLPGWGTPQRGEVVVFRSVEDSTPNLNIVKRVIGIPGDTLQMVHDTMIRNGPRLDEPYALHTALTPVVVEEFQLRQIRARQLPYYVGRDTARYHPTTHDWGPIVVPPGHYFMMGDNRDESYDSRYWGFLPRSHIRGRPLFIYMSVASDPFRIRWNRLFKHPS